MTFGNNDCKYHDSGPFQKEKQEFYGFIFDLWFNNHTPNQKYASVVKDTFMNGGYYKIDIDN
jgi:acyl-ACP thioesterase